MPCRVDENETATCGAYDASHGALPDGRWMGREAEHERVTHENTATPQVRKVRERESQGARSSRAVVWGMCSRYGTRELPLASQNVSCCADCLRIRDQQHETVDMKHVSQCKGVRHVVDEEQVSQRADDGEQAWARR